MISYLPYIIPLLTFFLGAGLTLLLKRKDAETAAISNYVREISDCANEWYNQLHELYIAARAGKKISSVIARFDFYGQNRIVLPKYLRALEVLRKHKKAASVVSEAEKILEILTTTYLEENGTIQKMCKAVGAAFKKDEGAEFVFMPGLGPGPEFFEVEKAKQASDYGIRLEEVIPTLDIHIQAINIEAGKLL
jgi:hypothetical protein